ncbi:MAG TPA: dihydropteroate synthase [Candidatus Saccharibacteria bacterium]|nr:dihydropteroate synthase [Candidatus Saccharibacteria bacterium]
MVQLVGILNITPDSFSDGGLFTTPEVALIHAKELAMKGAHIIDVGAQSTRPNAELLTIEQEWERLEPVLNLLANQSFEISIDTFYPEIIERAVRLIPNLIINDVTTAHDAAMRRLIASSGLRVFLSHLPISVNGDIQAAHKLAKPVDGIEQVRRELLERRDELLQLGASSEQIILDPGIGFGKTMRLNAELIDFAKQVPGVPVLIGYSRKRFIEQYLHKDRFSQAINTELAKQAQASGAAYLRVHEIPWL